MRDDIHRPEVIVPGDYEYLAVFYQGSNEHLARAYSEDPAYKAAVEAPFVRLFRGNWLERQTCDSCGATFNHGALLRHKSGELVHFGHICADKQIGLSPEAHRAKRTAIHRAEKARWARGRAARQQADPGMWCQLCHAAIRDGDKFAVRKMRGWDRYVHQRCEENKQREELAREGMWGRRASNGDDHRILSKFRERGFERA